MTSLDRAFEDRYRKLNPAQRAAVDAIDGPVMVVAGPGSGKTEILSLRVANILRRTDASPGSILCLTFTDSAAINMRRRLFDLIGEAAFRVSIHTFHSFASRVISRYPQFFFEGADFHPADDVTQLETLRRVFEGLPHDHELRSFHPEQGFVYLRDARSRIKELKRAGVSPRAFRRILEENEGELDPIDDALAPFAKTVSKKLIPEYARAADALKSGGPLAQAAARSLSAAIGRAEAADSTAALSDWKKRHMRKDALGRLAWKDRLNASKMRALADVYESYEGALYEQGYFDYDDMIMRVIETLESAPELRMELEEAYQYILVDEFQDTNGAQMRMIELLTSSDAHEGRPNIMAVGDDDQAVYKFQGAEIENIVSFAARYRDPSRITLTENYRSTKRVLDVAGNVISFNESRLTNVMEGIDKTLVQANHDIEAGGIYRATLETPLQERKFIVDEIGRIISRGVSPRDIAVIAREHDSLQSLVPYFHERGIPVSYERQRNVLHERHVRELVMIARYIHARAGEDPFSGDYLLPEILRYPFWGIEEREIWKLARHATEAGESWTEAMASTDDERLRGIGAFLGELSARSASSTAEFILDNLIGTLSVALDDDALDAPEPAARLLSFKSPFREYYWSQDRLSNHKAEYLSFLSSLRVFIEALREYRSGAPLSLSDLVEFVDLREKNKLPLLDNSPFAQALDAVSLLTAHKAKGQEYPYVFIMSCQNDVWASSSARGKLAFPANLPLTPADDGIGDFARIFFVAVTRARHTLYLTGYRRGIDGRESLPLSFIPRDGDIRAGAIEDATPKEDDGIEALELAQASELSVPKTDDERAIFEPLLRDYQMSVTHLANFLDIERGGPRHFFEQNMLRFPQAKTPSLAFGTAVHEVLDRIHQRLRREGALPGRDEIVGWSASALRKERLGKPDEAHLREKGASLIPAFIEARASRMSPRDDSEVDFKHEGVVVLGARLTGKIDEISYTPDGLILRDYKTGKAIDSWEPKDERGADKAARYRRQLVFYKLLVEHSTRFSGQKAAKGAIDFVEPLGGEFISLECGFSAEEADRLARLASAVYRKIVALDFPDVSSYSPDREGRERFEEDLLAGRV